MALLAATNSAGLWTPANISTALWLDASDSATITAASGLVSQWNDKSGNSRNATASGALRPTTATRTINSLNTLDFSGANAMSFAAAPLASTTSALAVFVFQLDADPPSTAIGPVLGDWGTGSQANHFPYSDGVIYENFMTNFRKTCGNPTPSMATNACVASMTSANGLWELYINGSLLYTTSSNTYAIGGSPRIGASSVFYVDGRIAEIAVVANSTSTTTRQLLEGYLAGATRWGLQSLLPAGHPYKSAAPTA
jgi:hypothetical protein